MTPQPLIANDPFGRSAGRVAVTAALAACPQLSFAAAPIYFDLGGTILVIGGWVIGVPILAIASLRPRARLARRLLLSWLLVPVLLFAGSLVWDSLENRYTDLKVEEFAKRFQQFCKEREQPFVNTGLVTPVDMPAAILVTQNERHKDARGIPVAQTVAEATPCEETQVREFHSQWTRDGKATLQRFSACPLQRHDPESRATDANFELVLARSYDSVVIPMPYYGLTGMYAFSAEIRDLRTGELLASRTLCSADLNPPAIEHLGITAKFGISRLLVDAFPRERPRQGAAGS